MKMVTEDFHKFSLDEYNGSNNVFFIQKIASVCKAEKKHSHDFMQIYYISNGLLKHVVENDEVLLARGDMFIIPPDICHRIVRINENTEFVSISFSLDFINYSPFLISRTYFCHLFKHYTGMSFKAYINNLRVNQAQSLIKETNLSMEEIASTVGYQGTANFYKNFKRIVGTTPHGYTVESSDWKDL